MEDSLKKNEAKIGKVTTSAIWTLSSNFVDRIIGFISLALLARLLTPMDFGIVAIASSIVALVELFNAFGFDWAIVRHPDPTKTHYNSAWTLRILFGLATAIVILIVSPFAVMFLNQSNLMPLLAVMALSIFIASFENIGIVDFRRNFAFDKEFIFRFWSKIAGVVVTLTIAFIYRSYWALVLGSLATRTMSTFMSYVLHGFRPQFTLKKASELFSFSIWLLLGNITVFLRGSFINLFIGHTFGAKSTGFYSVTNEIAHLPITELTAPINRAVFSKYVQDSHEFSLVQEAYLTTASAIWMIALPASCGILVVSHEIIAILLGQQWTNAGVILQLLTLGGAFSVLVANSQYVFWTFGHTKMVTALSTFTLGFLIVFSFILTNPYGLYGVAAAYVVATLLTIPINYYFLWKLVGIRFILLAKRVWRICIAAVGMLILLKCLFLDVPIHSSQEAILPLMLKVFSGIGIYLTLLFGLWIICKKPEGPESFAIRTLKSYWLKYV